MATEGTHHEDFDTRWCPKCRMGFGYSEPLSSSPQYGWTSYYACFRCRKGYTVRYRSGRNPEAPRGYYVTEEVLSEEAVANMRALEE